MEPVIQLTSAFLTFADRDPKTQARYGPNDYLDDPRAIALARIIEQDLGISEVQILGGGSYGIAAATAEEGGDVVKITLDASEVESGTVLTNTPLDAYPANVVHVQGAWYVRKLRIFADSWYDPVNEEHHQATKRIGLLRMERVLGLDEWRDAHAITGLGEYTRWVKGEQKVWAHQIRKLSRAKARERFLKASTQLEGLLAATSVELRRMGEPGWQIPRDVSRAIGQLRTLGIYGVDFHGGNVGWVPATPATTAREATSGSAQTVPHAPSFDARLGHALPAEEPGVYKVFDIGMSSAGPKAPKPVEIGRSKTARPPRVRLRTRVDEEAYAAPLTARPVRVAELG